MPKEKSSGLCLPTPTPPLLEAVQSWKERSYLKSGPSGCSTRIFIKIGEYSKVQWFAGLIYKIQLCKHGPPGSSFALLPRVLDVWLKLAACLGNSTLGLCRVQRQRQRKLYLRALIYDSLLSPTIYTRIIFHGAVSLTANIKFNSWSCTKRWENVASLQKFFLTGGTI